jgi:carbamoyltransferase
MLMAHNVCAEKPCQIPATTHVDGTGRVQTVNRHQNPRFYKLIHEFARQTGVPVLLNTSFNENEPIVCRPQEALECFLRTKMDLIVLGDFRHSPRERRAIARAFLTRSVSFHIVRKNYED